MEPIYPITSLAKEVKEVKAQAEHTIVRITENGKGAYVFTSERVLDEFIRREREDAVYEAYLIDAIGKGIDDIYEGRYVTSRQDLFTEAAKRRAARG